MSEDGAGVLVSSGYENIRFWEIREGKNGDRFVTFGEMKAMQRFEKGKSSKKTYTCNSGEGIAKDLSNLNYQPGHIRGTPVKILGYKNKNISPAVTANRFDRSFKSIQINIEIY